MFVNFSNHPSNKWDDDQMQAAQAYGEVVDLPFPVVDPDGDEAYIAALADECAERILALSPQAVMCQGEFTLTFAVVERLKAAGVLAVAGCSRRDALEVEVNGAIEKTTVFHFARFREY